MNPREDKDTLIDRHPNTVVFLLSVLGSAAYTGALYYLGLLICGRL